MKNLREEQYEYEKFMFELANKVHELKQDFDKLSIKNKYRVENELKKDLAVQSLAGVFEHFNMHR